MRSLALLVVAAACGRIGFEPGAPRDASGDAPADASNVGYFLSPAGDDAAAGTRAAPWQTFTAAIPRLQPGDRLTLLDGEYDTRVLGALRVDCSATAQNGTLAAPINVRADHPRRAHLFGSTTAIDFQHCSFWEVDDLFAEGLDDALTPAGAVVLLYYDTSVVARGLLVSHPDRYANNNALEIGHSTGVVVEDTEAYDFFRSAFTDYNSHGTQLRRLYANGRGTADLAGGFTSTCPGGDTGVSSYYSSTALFEDVVIEGVCDNGFEVAAGRTSAGDTGLGDGNALVADIVLGPGAFGFRIVSDCDAAVPCSSPDRIASDNTITNSVAIGFDHNFDVIGMRNHLDHVTAFPGSGNGIDLEVLTPSGGLVASADVVAALVIGGAIGINSVNQTSWSVAHSNVKNAVTAYSPNDANVTTSTTIDPGLIGCQVYLPPTSAMIGAGPNGTNIGADVRVLAQGGVPTTNAYWRPDGTFAGCGAVIAGVNDDPATSCIGVGKRLQVNTSGCPLL
jgi:hypothetical protein